MSTRTPIPVACTHAQHSDQSQEANAGQTFQAMQENMEHELEKRRRDWEQEVGKMQMDFFKLRAKPGDSDQTDGHQVDLNVAPSYGISTGSFPLRAPGTEIIDISNSKNLYTEKPDGTRVYCLKFDVRGFEPGEISVRAEDHKLSVQAKHQDELGHGRKTTRQFNRQMDLPDDVDPEQIQASLSADGILSVEAPVSAEVESQEKHGGGQFIQAPSYDYQRENNNIPPHAVTVQSQQRPMLHTLAPPVIGGGGHTSAFRPITPPGSPRSILTRYANPLVVIVNGQRKLKLTVDIGDGYTSSDIIVTCTGFKVTVRAQHEQMTPWHSRRQFSREFDLPEEIEPSTLHAVLDDSGRIIMGASVKKNHKHDLVIRSILEDLPENGQPCHISVK